MSGNPDGRYALRKRSQAQDASSSAEVRTRGRPRRCRELCPICQVHISGSRSEVLRHVETCLLSPPPPPPPHSGDHRFDEYEWAGQRRVRSTAFLEGGRGDFAGFTSITHGNEDEVLDIENELLHKIGPSQYSTADIIFPQAETAKEQSERDSILLALGHKKVFEPPDDEESTSLHPSSPPESSDDALQQSSGSAESLKKQIYLLQKQNQELRQKTICKICMDAYERPLISLECWHAHCEQCWLRSLGVKKLCPQCKVITNPEDLRRIYL
eukprot:TRINITY_DN3580_c0_g1_i1.p1 TRINITY_DN3580_c0_g1~~TRINITY_DN3580_c0_g1_i1.p1  ORF type:complete len:282 (+),score=62.98 TRINITY_DN3580_c0_g1_i1:37-846(+)